jgi:hypothetical protein
MTMLPSRPDECKLSSYIYDWEGNLISCRTLMSVRTRCRNVWMDATLNCLKFLNTEGRPDAWLGRPDGSLGSDFSDLDSAQNLLWASWTFFFWNEDSEINGIPNNAANHKTNKSGFETITSNIASTSKTIFVKPEVAESHNACEEKGKAVIIWKIKWLLI